MNFNEARELFFVDYRANNPLSSLHTINFHKDGLKCLEKFLQQRDKNCLNNVALFCKEHIIKFVSYMHNLQYSGSTISHRLKTLRLFLNFLNTEGEIQENLAEKIKPKVSYNQDIVPYSNQEIKKMFNKLNTSKKMDIRLCAIFKLLLDTGLRLKEFNMLNVGDIDLNKRTVFVIEGKGKKSRRVPFGYETQRWLIKYMDAFNIKQTDLNAPLFQKLKGGRWKRSAIQKEVKKFGEKLDIDACSHKYRHTFAINYLIHGGDSFSLQYLLGHKDLDMVKIYVNIANHLAQQLYISNNDVFFADEKEIKKIPSQEDPGKEIRV